MFSDVKTTLKRHRGS